MKKGVLVILFVIIGVQLLGFFETLNYIGDMTVEVVITNPHGKVTGQESVSIG